MVLGYPKSGLLAPGESFALFPELCAPVVVMVPLVGSGAFSFGFEALGRRAARAPTGEDAATMSSSGSWRNLIERIGCISRLLGDRPVCWCGRSKKPTAT